MILLQMLKKKCQEEKESRIWTVSEQCRTGNLHEVLERTAESAVRGELAAQKRLSEAEPEINLCGELELKNRIYQESHTKTSQETEALRRIGCEETD